jgi:hypothetical protein
LVPILFLRHYAKQTARGLAVQLAGQTSRAEAAESSGGHVKSELHTRLSQWLSRESELNASIASSLEEKQLRRQRLLARKPHRFAARRLAAVFHSWFGPYTLDPKV